MKLIKRYIALSIMQTTLLVLLVLVGLQLFVTFIGQLDDMGHGNYNLWQVLLYTPLTLPVNIYNLFPMAGLLGSLLGLGSLASHNELIIMRASGVTITQIIKATMSIALFMWMGMFIIGEVAGPPLIHIAETNKRIAEFELDESYFGAKRVRGKRGRGAAGKTPVFGLLKRQGKVFVSIVPNCSRASLMPMIQGKILEGSTIQMVGELMTGSF